MVAEQAAAGPAPKEPEADMAQAFREIAQGEATATRLETHLSAVEAKIDALLSSVEASAPSLPSHPATSADAAAAAGSKTESATPEDARTGAEQHGGKERG